MNHNFLAIAESLAQHSRICIATHRNADGDALGSMTALAHVCRHLGKEVRLYCETEIADNLTWVVLPVPLVRDLSSLGDWRPDLLVTVDCGDERRAGAEIEALLNAVRSGANTELATACIDHHTGNPLYAQANWVEAGQSSTGAMIARLARHFAVPLTGSLAESLYLAVSTDTGFFRYGNTNAEALDLAADLVRGGLDVAGFTEKLENNWSIARMHLWGALMSDVRLECDGRVAVMVVTREMLDRYGAKIADLEGLASWLRQLKGVAVVLFARTSHLGCKISLRSVSGFNVQAIAARFGGGGHVSAAGVDMAVPPCEAAEQILEAIAQSLGQGD